MSGTILPWRGIWPQIADSAFIAPTAAIIITLAIVFRTFFIIAGADVLKIMYPAEGPKQRPIGSLTINSP